MRRSASSAIVLVFFTIGVEAAEPIHLTCSGHWWATEAKIVGQPIDGQSVIIDFDRKSVTGSLGDFELFRLTDSSVAFRAPFEESGKVTGMFYGSVDRVTGKMSLNATRDNKTYPIVYNLTCLRTKPIF